MTPLQNLRKTFSKTLFQLKITINEIENSEVNTRICKIKNLVKEREADIP